MARKANSDLEVWKQYVREPTVELRNQLVEKYFYVVEYQAAKMAVRTPACVEADELVSAGSLGLIDAVEAYNPFRGVKFDTYCVPRVWGAMKDWLRSIDPVSRLSRIRQKNYTETVEQLTQKLGRAPCDGELAASFSVSQKTLAKIRKDAFVASTSSLDHPVRETDGGRTVCYSELEAGIDRKEFEPSDLAQIEDFWRLATKGLLRSERAVVIGYYRYGLSMKEVGQCLGKSESRISQLHKAILPKIRERLCNRRDELVRKF